MNKYEMQEFNVWINDTQLRCLAHANNLLILQFKRPGTILYSETVTMLNDNPDSLGTIHFSGDGGEASFRTTWNPILPVDYHEYSSSYLHEKLTSIGRDEYQRTGDSIDKDFEIYSQELESDYADDKLTRDKALRLLNDIHDTVVDYQDSSDETIENEVYRLREYDDEMRNFWDWEAIEDYARMGRRFSTAMRMYHAMLCRLYDVKAYELQAGDVINLGAVDMLAGAWPPVAWYSEAKTND